MSGGGGILDTLYTVVSGGKIGQVLGKEREEGGCFFIHFYTQTVREQTRRRRRDGDTQIHSN